MTRYILCSLLFAGLSLAGAAMSGCESTQHKLTEPEDGTVIACKECYDEVHKVLHPTSPRGGATRTETHTRHECPSCKTEMSIYTENGITKVKCAHCAPEGLACDKCLPPKGYVPPAEKPAPK